MKITVFTPTYNRAYTIHKCYNSLCKQKFKDFEWLIVDDGSNDNTEEVIKKFVGENKITIRYFKQENQGKHVAINTAAKLARGELFFIVDSDDFLTDNALQIINNYWTEISDHNVVGIGGRVRFINRENKRFNFKYSYHDQDSITFSLNEGNSMDKAEIVKTEIIRKYPLPVIEGEKFMAEFFWYAIANDGYKLRWIQEETYVAEYLEDGLTNNAYKQRVESIDSTILAYKNLFSYKLPKKYKIRYFLNYLRYSLIKVVKRWEIKK